MFFEIKSRTLYHLRLSEVNNTEWVPQNRQQLFSKILYLLSEILFPVCDSYALGLLASALYDWPYAALHSGRSLAHTSGTQPLPRVKLHVRSLVLVLSKCYYDRFFFLLILSSDE